MFSNTEVELFIRSDWDQSDNFVKLYVDLADLMTQDHEKIQTSFGHYTLDVLMHDIKGSNYRLTIYNLAQKMVPKESRHATKSGEKIY